MRQREDGGARSGRAQRRVREREERGDGGVRSGAARPAMGRHLVRAAAEDPGLLVVVEQRARLAAHVRLARRRGVRVEDVVDLDAADHLVVALVPGGPEGEEEAEEEEEEEEGRGEGGARTARDAHRWVMVDGSFCCF